MRLKSYFAATVESAMKLAGQELGPDAMLVNSRRTGTETRHLGEYEVVFAMGADQSPKAGTIETPGMAFQSGPGTTMRAPGLDKLSHEVADLKRQMERLASTLSRSSASYSNLTAHPELSEAFALLTSAEVDTNLAYDIVSRIGAGLNDRLLQSEIQKLIAVEPRLGREGSQRIIVAVVGPPGSGKTTCLVKLAARYALPGRRPSQILSMDTYRVAAAEQLRSYAAILGIGFQVTETTAAVAQAIEEHSSKELILIDTPGFGRHEMQESVDLAKFLARRADIDTHLVIPASLKAADMPRTIDRYEIFRPAKLLFTRTDETETYGSILNQVVRTGKPVSFLTDGQQVPEDIHAPTKESLTGLILHRRNVSQDLASSVAAA
ncbi:MAG: hypothetical protein ACR2NN_09975 [Bryobacteraceae bacterium]